MASQQLAVGNTPHAIPLITVKVAIDGTNRRFKLPITDLSVAVFSSKMRDLLQVPSNQLLTLERFSDSSASFVPVDSRNPSSYKQLYRAAKAKLKLRLRATVKLVETQDQEASSSAQKSTEAAPEELSAAATTPHPPKPTVQEEPEVNVAEAPKLPPLSQILNGVSDSHRVTSEESASNTTNIVTSALKLEPPSFHRKSAFQPPFAPPCWQVCCNNCDKQVTTEHYHCGICDGGDYDLCEGCINSGAVCGGEGHWMIKRTLKNGSFVNSTTQTVAPKPKENTQNASAKKPEVSKPTPSMPGAFNSENKPAAARDVPARICNQCIRHLPQKMVASCKECEDYDLCMPCLVDNKHGHHPGHSFSYVVPNLLENNAICQPGRNMRHQAICDNCNHTIFGVRYKCLDCPDFDFCGPCHTVKKLAHNHRFVPVYEPLAAPTAPKYRHYGVYCDGPLCKAQGNQSYIQGTRYKCAVCNDTDYCANCEAHPSNQHNGTHPMIKFKTPIREVSVQTYDSADNTTTVLGDAHASQPVTRGPSTSTPPRYTQNASSTETLPAYTAQPAMPTPERQQIIHPLPQKLLVPASELKAVFVSDSVADGETKTQGQVFCQTWTLSNPGPHSWPAGCSVRHIGGDYMLNVDQKGPSSVADLAHAQESNATHSPILPGQLWRFGVQLKAPTKVGKHISYWRLKAPDGTPFGHKLWCDITVPAMVTPLGAAMKPAPPPQVAGLSDMQKQLMLLEQQNKRRLLMSRQEQQITPLMPPASSSSMAAGVKQDCAGDDYETQLRLLEQQNKRRQLKSRQEYGELLSKAATANALKAPGATLATEQAKTPEEIYQMSLTLLEQQNKRRQLMARQEAEDGSSIKVPNPPVQSLPAAAPVPQQPRNGDDFYQMQLRLLEQQNKHRLMMARQAQDEVHMRSQEGIMRTTVLANRAWPRTHVKPLIAETATLTSTDIPKAVDSAKEPDVVNEKPAAEPAKESDSANDKAATEKTELTESGMVFPKLEKESPASSTHEDKDVSKTESNPETVKSPSVATVATTETDSVVNEVTAQDEFENDSDEDEGFLTDEEYDILDASDEEIINGGGAA